MDEIAETEEQYQRNVRSHTEIIDRSLRKYKERIDRENETYQINLNEMLDERDDEVEQINRQQNEDEILLQAIIRNVQRQLNESLNNIKSITLSDVINFALQLFHLIRLCIVSNYIILYIFRRQFKIPPH